jgi:AraC-like DNA-binding protein
MVNRRAAVLARQGKREQDERRGRRKAKDKQGVPARPADDSAPSAGNRSCRAFFDDGWSSRAPNDGSNDCVRENRWLAARNTVRPLHVQFGGVSITLVGSRNASPVHQHPRHRHRHGYIAVVLSGNYEEAGLAGRFTLQAGDVVVHQLFDAHLNHVSRSGADVLNLPLPPDARLPAAFRICDVDAIARLAEHDMQVAAMALAPLTEIGVAEDWPDLLASAISEGSNCKLGAWAERHGFAAETLSRGFRKAYGITPARFRFEVRAHRALRLIQESRMPLAAVAADSGFSDQPHLTRAIVQLTGRPAGYWRRRSNLFKTGLK